MSSPTCTRNSDLKELSQLSKFMVRAKELLSTSSVCQTALRGNYANSIAHFTSIQTHLTEYCDPVTYVSKLPNELQGYIAQFMDTEDIFIHKSLFSFPLRNALTNYETESEDPQKYFVEDNSVIDYEYSTVRCVVSLVNAFPHFTFYYSKTETNDFPTENISKISEILIDCFLTETGIANFCNFLDNAKVTSVSVNEATISICESFVRANASLKNIELWGGYIGSDELLVLSTSLMGKEVESLLFWASSFYCSAESLVKFIGRTSLKRLNMRGLVGYTKSEFSVILDALKCSALDSVHFNFGVIEMQGEDIEIYDLMTAVAEECDSVRVTFEFANST